MKSASETNPRVIVVDGDMDALAIKQLRSEFENVLENDDHDVSVDMTHVEFIDSSGIGALVFLFKRLTAVGRALDIRGVHGQPRDLFSLLRIGKTIPVQVTEGNEAVEGAMHAAEAR